MKHEVVHTSKGVLAIRSLEADETMHPGVGPLVEAEQLYVRQSRLRERLVENRLVVFDVGMGAGSNALATRRAAMQAPAGAARLDLVSFERDLEPLTVALGMPEAFNLQGESGEAARALLTHGRHEHARVSWQLRHGDLGSSERIDAASWAMRRPAGKARGGGILDVLRRRATTPAGMDRRPNRCRYSLTSP